MVLLSVPPQFVVLALTGESGTACSTNDTAVWAGWAQIMD
jgi:hypothetical protein